MSLRLTGATVLPDKFGTFIHFSAGETLPKWAEGLVGEELLESAQNRPSESEKAEDAQEDAEGENGAENGGEDSSSGDDLIGGTVEEPTRDAKVAEWRDFARSLGATEEDLEGKTRNELRATYGSD